MHHTLTFTTALLATLALLTSPLAASPLQPEPRAAATVYLYTTATTVAMPATTASTNTTCPNTIISNTADCPSGCTAAPLAGAVGVATDSWSCMEKPPETSWTSVVATSTCGGGSAVTTYSLWGGQRVEGCKATAT